MTILSHTLSASYIAVVSSGANSAQTGLIAAAVISGAVVDLDHLYYFWKDRSLMKRGNLHNARSMFHELIGFAVAGSSMLLLSFINQQLAYVIGVSMMVHLVEDVLVGKTIPFSPIDKTEFNLLPQSFKLKVVLDILVSCIFGVLWIKFLNG